mmetsp:Transcript_16036/g.48178  ORF Transcript_16036/g.48178 Transcript_16036/m.48178 type:complete len:1595 (+) Transcript_16036:188-4972(+)
MSSERDHANDEIAAPLPEGGASDAPANSSSEQHPSANRSSDKASPAVMRLRALAPTKPPADSASSSELSSPTAKLAVGETTSRRGEHQKSWEMVQLKSFTAWVNYHLKRGNYPTVGMLAFDLQTGIALHDLLSQLTQRKLPRITANPRMKLQCMLNIKICLDVMAEEGMRLTNIGPEDIYNGNRKLIMAVIWALIHHYQLTGRISGKTPRVRSGSAHTVGDKVDTSKYTRQLSPDQQLLMWAQSRVRPFGVEVSNFTTSFQDGKAFAAVVSSIKNTFMFWRHSRKQPQECMEAAFKFAETFLNVPQLLNAADIVEAPDKKSIQMYLAVLYDMYMDTFEMKPLPDADATEFKYKYVENVVNAIKAKAEELKAAHAPSPRPTLHLPLRNLPGVSIDSSSSSAGSSTSNRSARKSGRKSCRKSSRQQDHSLESSSTTSDARSVETSSSFKLTTTTTTTTTTTNAHLDVAAVHSSPSNADGLHSGVVRPTADEISPAGHDSSELSSTPTSRTTAHSSGPTTSVVQRGVTSATAQEDNSAAASSPSSSSSRDTDAFSSADTAVVSKADATCVDATSSHFSASPSSSSSPSSSCLSMTTRDTTESGAQPSSSQAAASGAVEEHRSGKADISPSADKSTAVRTQISSSPHAPLADGSVSATQNSSSSSSFAGALPPSSMPRSATTATASDSSTVSAAQPSSASASSRDATSSIATQDGSTSTSLEDDTSAAQSRTSREVLSNTASVNCQDSCAQANSQSKDAQESHQGGQQVAGVGATGAQTHIAHAHQTSRGVEPASQIQQQSEQQQQNSEQQQNMQQQQNSQQHRQFSDSAPTNPQHTNSPAKRRNRKKKSLQKKMIVGQEFEVKLKVAHRAGVDDLAAAATTVLNACVKDSYGDELQVRMKYDGPVVYFYFTPLNDSDHQFDLIFDGVVVPGASRILLVEPLHVSDDEDQLEQANEEHELVKEAGTRPSMPLLALPTMSDVEPQDDEQGALQFKTPRSVTYKFAPSERGVRKIHLGESLPLSVSVTNEEGAPCFVVGHLQARFMSPSDVIDIDLQTPHSTSRGELGQYTLSFTPKQALLYTFELRWNKERVATKQLLVRVKASPADKADKDKKDKDKKEKDKSVKEKKDKEKLAKEKKEKPAKEKTAAAASPAKERVVRPRVKAAKAEISTGWVRVYVEDELLLRLMNAPPSYKDIEIRYNTKHRELIALMVDELLKGLEDREYGKKMLVNHVKNFNMVETTVTRENERRLKRNEVVWSWEMRYATANQTLLLFKEIIAQLDFVCTYPSRDMLVGERSVICRIKATDPENNDQLVEDHDGELAAMVASPSGKIFMISTEPSKQFGVFYAYFTPEEAGDHQCMIRFNGTNLQHRTAKLRAVRRGQRLSLSRPGSLIDVNRNRKERNDSRKERKEQKKRDRDAKKHDRRKPSRNLFGFGGSKRVGHTDSTADATTSSDGGGRRRAETRISPAPAPSGKKRSSSHVLMRTRSRSVGHHGESSEINGAAPAPLAHSDASPATGHSGPDAVDSAMTSMSLGALPAYAALDASLSVSSLDKDLSDSETSDEEADHSQYSTPEPSEADAKDTPELDDSSAAQSNQ